MSSKTSAKRLQMTAKDGKKTAKAPAKKGGRNRSNIFKEKKTARRLAGGLRFKSLVLIHQKALFLRTTSAMAAAAITKITRETSEVPGF